MEDNFNISTYNLLKRFVDNNCLPHLLINGPHGCGKKTILFDLIKYIYNYDSQLIKKYMMILNCTQDKGIRMIREDLKFFAKTNIPNISFDNKHSVQYKVIVLLNAEYLTIDAQSALRRCMELYSNTSRFLMVVANKEKILKPILSRVCDIYCASPKINNNKINLNEYNVNKKLDLKEFYKPINKKLSLLVNQFVKNKNFSLANIFVFSKKLYNNSFNKNDLIKCLEKNKTITENLNKKIIIEKKIILNRICSYTRSDLMIMFYSLYLFLISSNLKLENVFFI